MIEKSILTPQETAEYLGIGMSKCYELLRSKDFPVLTLGKLKRVSKVALDEWISKHTQEKGGLL